MATDLTTTLSSLSSPDPAVRRRIAEQLATSGPPPTEACVALVRASDDEDEQVREWVTSALEDMEAADASQVDDLAGLLHHDGDAAFWAATLLGRCGSVAANVLPLLETAANTHPRPHVRQRASWAMEQCQQ